MLVYLKDVEFTEVKALIYKAFPDEKITNLIKDSDYLEDRSLLVSSLKKYNENVCLLCIYDHIYLKWSLVYTYAIFKAAKKQSYVMDSNGVIKSITLLDLFINAGISFFSVLIQFWGVLSYKYSLHRTRRIPEAVLNKELNRGSRVAYLRTTDTFNLRAGGSLGHTVGIIEGFKKAGNQVIYFGIDDIQQVRGIDKVIIKPSRYLNLVNFFSRYSYNHKFVSVILKKSNNIDFIYQRASRDNFSGVILSRKLNIPLVLEFNSFLEWELSGANHFVHKLFTKPTIEIEKFNLKHAHVIIVVSKALKEQLVDYGINSRKILVAPNAVDGNRFTPVGQSCQRKCELNIPKNSIVVGFSGTFGFWHGIDILVDAIINISLCNPKCYFLLIGDGPYRKIAEERLSKFKNVIFTGIVPYEAVKDYLILCDILLSPHNIPKGDKFIGSPTKLFEYMACGKVIIASDLDQIGEVITPARSIVISKNGHSLSPKEGGEVGIKVKPGSVDELTFAISLALIDLSDLKYLGINAREKAISDYGWDSVAASVRERISEIVKHQRDIK